MKDTFDIKRVKGWLILKGIDKNGNESILYDNHNALTLDAKQVLIRALAGDAWALVNISCLKASSVLAANTTLARTYPSADSVQFTCTFDEASFNDTLDEMQFISNGGPVFSSVTGLAVYKPNTLKLQVTWKITIN